MVDGPNRAGKSTIISILTSLERVELERIEEVYDYIGFLSGLGKIDKDAAVAVLRASADIHLYNLYLSRNVNCRPSDKSSIFKSAKPLVYLSRFFAKDHKAAITRITAEDPILSQHAHYQFENIGVFLDAFSDSFRVIEVLRHPVDLVQAVVARGYGGDVCESLYNVHLCLRHGKRSVPLLAKGWEKEFLRLGPYDRVVRMLHGYQMRAYETFKGLSGEQRKQVFVSVFEDFTAHPMEIVERMAAFLNTRPTARTPKMIHRAGCPRSVSSRDRDQNFREIRENCSRQSFELLDAMISNYQSRWER